MEIDALRQGLTRAENPHGTLQGARRRLNPNISAHTDSMPESPCNNPNMSAHAGSMPESSCNSRCAVCVTGEQCVTQRIIPRQSPGAIVLPHENRGKKLDVRRARLVHLFIGRTLPAKGWQCAICLRTDVASLRMARLPNCKHVFHAECCFKWFERASTCPYCRDPV